MKGVTDNGIIGLALIAAAVILIVKGYGYYVVWALIILGVLFGI
jgi:hypothetical protein